MPNIHYPLLRLRMHKAIQSAIEKQHVVTESITTNKTRLLVKEQVSRYHSECSTDATQRKTDPDVHILSTGIGVAKSKIS
jgi:hypothetical protein